MKKIIPLLFLLFTLNYAHADWQPANGAQLGDAVVNSLASIGSNLFAGTGNGVYLSTNNGTSWAQVNNGLTDTSVVCLAVMGTKIFAGTLYGGVFLSSTNGGSWSAVNTGLSDPNISSIAVSGSNIYVGTHSTGVFLSSNSGGNWINAQPPLNAGNVAAVAGIGANIFASTDTGGIYLSSNNGTSWMAVNTGLTEKDITAMTVSGTNLFAATSSHGVFITSNNGTNWTYKGLNVTPVGVLASYGQNIFAGVNLGDGISISTNNGDSWTSENTGLPANANVFAITTDASYIYVGGATFSAGFGVYKRALSEVAGIKEAEEPYPFYVYKANNSFILQFNKHPDDAQLLVCDVTGREVLSAKVINDKMDIETRSWQAGVYFVNIITGNKKYLQKIIVD